MSPAAFLLTSLSLGVMVLAAGAYALLYGAARFKNSRGLFILAGLAYGVLALDAAGYLRIPPLTWGYLQRTHRDEGVHT